MGFTAHFIKENVKPLGYRKKTYGKVEKKKRKTNFKPIKVTQQEIEEGRKYKIPKTNLFNKVNNK